MNLRKARGVLFIILSAAASVLVMVILAGYLASVRSEVGDKIQVYRATKDIPAYSKLTSDMFETVSVPERWAVGGSQLSEADLVGYRAAVDLSKGATLTDSVLLAPSTMAADEREFALEVNAVTGIAGRVEPGAKVDIYAVFSDVPGLPKQVRVLVRDVRVISVGGSEVRQNADLTEVKVLPVTLSLKQPDALAVSYATSFAAEVRLVGLPSDLDGQRPNEQDFYDATHLGGIAVPEEGN